MFGRMNYFTDSPESAQKITVVNGYGVVKDRLLHVSLCYEGNYIYGDFNRDGLKDAAVIIWGGQSSTACYGYLAFLINDGKQLVHRVSYFLEDRATINSMKEHNGKVVIDMFVHQDGDCMAGPTRRVKNVYDYLCPDPDLVIPRGWTPQQQLDLCPNCVQKRAN